MHKIVEKKIQDVNFRFYNGMDLDILMNHPYDGSDGYIVCLIDNWVSCISKYNRSVKIDNMINGTERVIYKSDEFDNEYIMIYQCSDIPKEKMLEVVLYRLETTINFYGYPKISFVPNSID
jgi:hypothetical protein